MIVTIMVCLIHKRGKRVVQTKKNLENLVTMSPITKSPIAKSAVTKSPVTKSPIIKSHETKPSSLVQGYPIYHERCGVQIDSSLLNKLKTSTVKLPASSSNPPSLVNEPSKILYLLQTEECLPSQLRVALGNSSACQCDVVVLSFKNMCNDTSLPHVKYLFNSSTTWTTGRNVLFYTYIHKRSDRYLYYIMMDDDIHMIWREKWTEKFQSRNPWRSFEEFLRKTKPAIAALELGEKLLTHIENIQETRNSCMHPEYTITVRYDAAVNAFHYQAVEYALPYWDYLENESWHFSQLYLYIWTEIVFRGQVLVHRQLMANNSIHRPYPRAKLKQYNLYFPVMIDHIRKRLPTECQNAPLLEQCEKIGFDHLHTTSSTYSLPLPPPDQTISPFRYFAC